MAVNSMTFKQSATLINEVLEQMTGKTSIAPIDESEFVAVGTTLLQQGYDSLNTAISQVLERTIMSARSYKAIYPSLLRDSAQWGGITRKVTILDLEFEDDKAYDAGIINNTTGPDPFVVNRQKAVQFNFYGGTIYELIVTTTEDQLNQAFESSAQFGSFMAALATNIQNQITQKVEAESRIAVNNMIAADIIADGDRVIHLLTEYKADTGNTTITAANYRSAAEFEPFAKWMYGRLNTAIDMLKERSAAHHQNITSYNGAALNKPIMRHTPKEYLNIYLLADFMNHVNSSVLSSVFNNELLTVGSYEKVNYWQSSKAKDSINVKPNVLDEDGLCAAAAEAVNTSGIIGVLFDDEAAGITVKNEGVRSIENPRGRYFNNFHNWAVRYHNDQTENSIVLMLD